MADSDETNIIQRRRQQNRLAQSKRRDAIKSQLKKLEAENTELRAFKENIARVATAQSGASSVPCSATGAGAALSGLTDYLSGNMVPTPPASCSSYISMDDFMANAHSIGPPLELADAEVTGDTASPMDLATYHGTPSFATSPRQELDKLTKDFHRSTTELYGYTSTESGRSKSVDDGRDQALGIAVSSGHASMVQLLIKHGADVNAPIGQLSRTRLHDAAASADAKMVKLLLKQGADVSLLDAAGMTALQVAASADNIDVAEVLLQANT